MSRLGALLAAFEIHDVLPEITEELLAWADERWGRLAIYLGSRLEIQHTAGCITTVVGSGGGGGSADGGGQPASSSSDLMYVADSLEEQEPGIGMSASSSGPAMGTGARNVVV